jgi:hypothetical protein
MKQLMLNFVAFVLLANLLGCGQADKTKILEQYKYEEAGIVSDEINQKQAKAWVKEGITCYGIVVVFDNNKIPIRVKEVRAKVIGIQSDKVRMRSLENIKMAPVKGCNKFSISAGEDWDEVDDELFQTKEEAVGFITSKYPGLRME